MNSKERVAALLSKEIPDQMGLYEHFWPETLRDDQWGIQGYPKDADPNDFFDYDIAFPGGWFDSGLFPGQNEICEETPEWKVVRDTRGALLKLWKNKSGTPEHIGFGITDRAAWNKYRDRLLTLDHSRLGNLDAVRKATKEARRRQKYVVYGNLFIFELMRGTLGDITFLPALLDEPEWIHDFCRVYLEHFKIHYAAFFKEVGLPDGMWLYEDFGFTNGLFCSPATMREMVMPYEKELVAFFKSYGLPVILHSCGDIRKAIPLIIEAGFDCLQPMEAKAGCDVVEIAKTYGTKLAYMGNIDIRALETNDPAKVRQEILPKLQAMKEMRIPYLFHSDHSIPPTVSMKTYQLALELFRQNSAYSKPPTP